MNAHDEKGLRAALDLIANHLAEEAERALPGRREPGEHRRRLDLELDGEGRPLSAVLEDLRGILEATPPSANRRFFNQLYGGRDLTATVADLLIPVANAQMHTYKVAGPHVVVEQEVVRQLADKVGYDDGEGTFTAGGSLSNLMGLVLARDRAAPGFRETGEGPRLTVYTSEAGHYSIAKAMAVLGLGRGNLRRVPIDSVGRMDVSALRRLVAADRAADRVPAMINATAGTTVLGAFDPIDEIVAVGREAGAWVHVDAAFGGTALLSRRHRRLLAGCGESDSLSWNAHKMLGVPLLCSAFLVRRRGRLAASFDEPADYLFQGTPSELDPGHRSLQCGRRSDGLKLWATWRRHGASGLERRVDHLFDLARAAATTIAEDPEMTLGPEPQSVNVCFEVRGKSSVEICAALDRDGQALIGHGRVGDRRMIRLVCVNPALTPADLDELFAAIKSAAAELGAGDNQVEAEAAG